MVRRISVGKLRKWKDVVYPLCKILWLVRLKGCAYSYYLIYNLVCISKYQYIWLQTATSISGISCKYNLIPLHTEFKLEINHIPVSETDLSNNRKVQYNNEQQQTYNTFPVGSTAQHVTFRYVFFIFPGKRAMFFQQSNFIQCIIDNRYQA